MSRWNIAIRKENLFNKNTVLTVLLSLVSLLAINAMVPVSVDPNLKMVISKSKVPLRNLNQQRELEATKVVMLDALNLAHKNHFYHPQLGSIGYGDNFFADVEARFVVKKGGNYHFIVASDDGFSLRINDKELCRFLSDRALATQRCPVHLEKGEHSFALSYFQGGGHAGLRVQYGLENAGKLHWFGEDSSYLKIKK